MRQRTRLLRQRFRPARPIRPHGHALAGLVPAWRRSGRQTPTGERLFGGNARGPSSGPEDCARPFLSYLGPRRERAAQSAHRLCHVPLPRTRVAALGASQPPARRVPLERERALAAPGQVAFGPSEASRFPPGASVRLWRRPAPGVYPEDCSSTGSFNRNGESILLARHAAVNPARNSAVTPRLAVGTDSERSATRHSLRATTCNQGRSCLRWDGSGGAQPR